MLKCFQLLYNVLCVNINQVSIRVKVSVCLVSLEAGAVCSLASCGAWPATAGWQLEVAAGELRQAGSESVLCGVGVTAASSNMA